MVSSADEQVKSLVQWHTLKLNFPLLGCSSTAKSADFVCHESVVLPDDLQQLPRVSLSSGSTFLGVPVGGDIFVQQFSDDTLSKLEDLLQKVSRLGSGLGKFLLLRACFGACRVNHLLRTLDFLHGSRLANDAAVPFRKALDDLLRTATSDEQFTLACMASRRGGLGLKNPTWVHGPAFLASCFTYAASADSISHTFWADVSSAWNVVRSAFNLPINFLADFQPLLGFEPRDVSKHWKQQRWWQAHIDSAIEKRWSMQAPLRLRKLKELMAARFSVDVTSLVAPGSDQAAISDRGWVLSACMRIGIALDASDARPCAGCAMPMDPVGDHALCCAKLGVYARHNDLRDTFAALCVDAGLAVEIEQGPDGLRPADVLVHGLDNSPLAVDFSVVHPLQPCGGAPWEIGTPDGEVQGPCSHARLSSPRMVLLPLRRGGDGCLGRQSQESDAAPHTEVRAEAAVLDEGGWRSVQNSLAALTTSQLVSAAGARIPEPVRRRGSRAQRPVLVLGAPRNQEAVARISCCIWLYL